MIPDHVPDHLNDTTEAQRTHRAGVKVVFWCGLTMKLNVVIINGIGTCEIV